MQGGWQDLKNECLKPNNHQDNAANCGDWQPQGRELSNDMGQQCKPVMEWHTMTCNQWKRFKHQSKLVTHQSVGATISLPLHWLSKKNESIGLHATSSGKMKTSESNANWGCLKLQADFNVHWFGTFCANIKHSLWMMCHKWTDMGSVHCDSAKFALECVWLQSLCCVCHWSVWLFQRVTVSVPFSDLNWSRTQFVSWVVNCAEAEISIGNNCHHLVLELLWCIWENFLTFLFSVCTGFPINFSIDSFWIVCVLKDWFLQTSFWASTTKFVGSEKCHTNAQEQSNLSNRAAINRFCCVFLANSWITSMVSGCPIQCFETMIHMVKISCVTVTNGKSTKSKHKLVNLFAAQPLAQTRVRRVTGTTVRNHFFLLWLSFVVVRQASRRNF